jgi:hypothetical protein
MIFIAPFVVFMYYCWVLKRTFMLLFAGSFRPPRVETLGGTHMGLCRYPQQGRSDDTAVYDVFLAYSSDDHSAAGVREILSRQGLRLFDCHRDVNPGEQALSAWDRALMRSRSFVVLVSPGYTDSPLLSAQFQGLHFSMFSEDVAEDRLLLLLTQHCETPVSLGPQLPIIDLRQHVGRRQLETWIKTKLRVPDHRSLGQLYRDVVSDVRHLVLRSPLLAVEQGMGNNLNEARILGSTYFRTYNELKFDVFLSYCEDSLSDRQLAEKIKAELNRSGQLKIYDVAEDSLPGHPEVQLVTAASTSRAFVIILSPAYLQNPLTRRLQLQQLVQALNCRRISANRVLVVTNSTGGDAEGFDSTDDWHVPQWFKSFTVIQWTGNMSEDDHLRRVRRWAHRQLGQQRRRDRRQLQHL